MQHAVWAAFTAAAILFSLAPGAGAVASMSSSMACGPRRALFTVLGLQLALLAHLMFVVAGLGALLASSVWAFEALKYAGAGYLIWIGVRKWREQPDAAREDCVRKEVGAFSLIRTGMLVNISNPKSIVFLAAFLPQFIDPALPQLPQYFILGATALAVDTVVMSGYSFMAGSTRRFLSTPGRIRTQNRVFGSLFVGAGVALMTAEKAA